MATTTNFGWSTPDNTGYVKDGALAIRTLGSAIDTSLVDLKGGTTGQVLSKASGTDMDFVWDNLTAMTSIASGSLSGASVSITSISGSYKDLYLVIQNFRPATANTNLFATFNSDTATRYATEIGYNTQTTFASAAVRISQGTSNGTSDGLLLCTMPDYANATTWKLMNITGITNNNATPTTANATYWASAYNQTSAISSIQLFCQSGNFTSGSYTLYGVK